MLRRSIHDEDYEDYDDDDGMGCSSTYVPWSILDALGRGHPKHGGYSKTSSNWLMTIPLDGQFILDLTLAHMT